MGAALFLLALVGGAVVFALLTLSFPQVRGSGRLASTRAEAAQSWRSQDGGSSSRRVLLVGRPSGDRRSEEASLRAAGYDVRTCAGPEGSVETFPYGGCLLLDEEECPLASGTDAIVFGLELDSGAARSVLRGYRAARPGIPLCVRTSDRESQWYANLLRDCRVAPGGQGDVVVGLVEEGLGAERARVS